MPKSGSDTESVERLSSEEEPVKKTACQNDSSRNREELSDYEKQRLQRIEENKKRMESLGLHKIASSFMGSVRKSQKTMNDKKGKKKLVDEDDEYNPNEDDGGAGSSDENDDSDEDFSVSRKKAKKSSATPKRRGHVVRPSMESDFADDDEALKQAIALSLQDCAGFLDVNSDSPSRTSESHRAKDANSKPPATVKETKSRKRTETLGARVDSDKRKRKKSITNRVQMSKDEVLIHFFQFDETGKGGFNLRDLERIAKAHDFTWSENEMADMIHYFDSDGDGKISSDDFRKIAVRCNLLKDDESAATG